MIISWAVVLLAIGGTEQVLDDFQYPNVDSARQAWHSAEGTPPVELIKDGAAVALSVPAPGQPGQICREP